MLKFRIILATVAISVLSPASPSASAQGTSKGLSLSTIVIDPGHGGKDPGCTSPSGKTLEKTLALDISKRLKTKIEAGFPGVRVLLTRSDDSFIGLEERASFANRNSANLFISIHLNSVEGKRSGPNGYSVHILGQYTSKKKDLYAGYMDVVSRENSVIKLEEDYSTRYEGFDPADPESYIFMNLMQNAFLEQSLKFAQYVDEELRGGAIAASRGVSQDPFWVLWRAAMPSVLVECGFLSNPSDREAMITVSGRERFATDLFDAFCRFKKDYDGGVALKGASKATSLEEDGARREGVTGASPKTTEGGQLETQAEKTNEYFGTQVLVTSRQLPPGDPFFKGYEVRVAKAGTLNKYIIGCSKEIEDARREFRTIKDRFPDSFMVVVRDGEASLVK